MYPDEYHMRSWPESDLPRDYDWHSRKPLKDPVDWDGDERSHSSRRWPHQGPGSSSSRYKQALLPTPEYGGGSSRSGFRHHSSSSSNPNYRAPFPSKRSMTYTNPNILKNRAAAKASEAKAKEQAATTQIPDKPIEAPKTVESANEKEE
uniref:Uncharacterized protein n=1 Tax=Megaselia scalaris TaxID=36166 RepID=T1GGF6_MEGSC